MFARQLNGEAFHVATASDGEEGLRMARALAPSAITLDIMMPRMDGWAVLSQLQSDPSLRDIPVILVSMADGQDMGYALGARECLMKPINRERLIEALHKHVFDPATGSILIVEDDEESREMLERTLSSVGWRTRSADNGRAALLRLEEELPTLILLDLMMPEMDGFEFVHEIRQRESWSQIPIVVLTAKDLNEDDRKRLNGRVEHILAKGGYRRDQLIEEIRRLIRQTAGA